ncbi:MAG: nitroreductase, partial [Gammaproteobacteria bacterium]
CLQAVDRGLMVHQMGGFNADKARDLFKVPEQFTLMAMMTVGYQLPLEKLDDEIRERELSERQRHPIDHNFFEGCWNKPFQSE